MDAQRRVASWRSKRSKQRPNAVVVPGFYAALCAAENPEEFLSIIETSSNDTMDYTGSENLLRLLVIVNKLSPDLCDAINEKATGFL